MRAAASSLCSWCMAAAPAALCCLACSADVGTGAAVMSWVLQVLVGAALPCPTRDAFPALLAATNGFQRHATLLLYLNDVSQVGAADVL